MQQTPNAFPIPSMRCGVRNSRFDSRRFDSNAIPFRPRREAYIKALNRDRTVILSVVPVNECECWMNTMSVVDEERSRRVDRKASSEDAMKVGRWTLSSRVEAQTALQERCDAFPSRQVTRVGSSFRHSQLSQTCLLSCSQRRVEAADSNRSRSHRPNIRVRYRRNPVASLAQRYASRRPRSRRFGSWSCRPSAVER
jgi:hypothetical protein